MAPRWVALAILTTARVSLGVQFQSLASLGLPLSREFGLSYADLGFLIGLYMLPGIVLAIPGGLLGLRFGDQRTVCAGLVLMVAGGALTGIADSEAALIGGRLTSGIGATLLNVLMSKMIIDWFAGREIVLAMAVFINAYPIGVGIALLALGPLVAAFGWRIAIDATIAAPVAALALLLAVYRRHDNDGRVAAAVIPGARISGREVALVTIAGAIWGIFNGAYATFLGFAPILLASEAVSIGMIGFLLGASTWLGVVTIVLGGMIAQRWGHANALTVGSLTGCGICLALLPSTEPALPLLAFGLLLGLPCGILTALPAEVLRPQSRAAGIGLFYTGLYVGHAGLPPIAGWLQDLAGSPATSLYVAAALTFATVPLFGAFRLLQRRHSVPQTATP